MSRLTKILDNRLYPNFTDKWDISLFRDRVLMHISQDNKVLDLGAGAGTTKQLNFKGLVKRIYGVDIDRAVLKNPYLDEARIGSAESIPYDDETFDAVICCHVLEHLADPRKGFKEVYRVLKENGVFIVKTPNQFHYAIILAKITPCWFHRRYNKFRGRKEEDTFPTYYKANSEKRIRFWALLTGFSIESVGLIEGRPEYLRVSWPTYLLGALYEKMVNSADILRHLRSVIIACLRKNNKRE